MSIAYYNGKIAKKNDVCIPLTDRAIWFGDGVYDAAVGRNGKIYMEKEHLDRLYANMRTLEIRQPMKQEELSLLLRRMLDGGGCLDGFFLYIQVSRNGETRKHAYEEDAKSNLLITIDRWEMPENQPISLITYPDLRYRYCHIKTLNLLPSVLAAAEAERHGADEAVFHRENAVTECSHSNISILKSGRMITHPANTEILSGVARGCLISACKEYGIPVEERVFSADELRKADEILITSTSKFCLRANRLDGKDVGMRDEEKAALLCRRLREDFLLGTL